MKIVKNLFAVMALVVVASSCQKAMEYFPKGGDPGKRTIAQIVSMNDDYRLLKLALARTGLLDDLNTKGPFTVFAPNNKAFAAAGLGDASAIAKIDKETLKSILLYHVVSGNIKAGDIPVADNTPVKTLNEKTLYVTKKDGKVSVNGVSVINADIAASNGVIHAVDRVIIPATGNIVDVAAGNPDFSILVQLVQYASTGSTNVAALLSDPTKTFTVFAPTNKAFANLLTDLGASSLDDLKSKFSPDQVTGILAYHVIPALVYSGNLVDGAKPATLNGSLTVSLTSGPQLFGNGNGGKASNIVITDISATNGVVHVIDRVLLP